MDIKNNKVDLGDDIYGYKCDSYDIVIGDNLIKLYSTKREEDEYSFIREDVLKSLTPGQQVVKIVRDEMTELLGGTSSKINFTPNPPTIIMLVGLQGSREDNNSRKNSKFIKKARQKTITCCL